MDTSFDLLDRLDQFWKTGRGDDLHALLAMASERWEPMDIRADLCAADLEWRLRCGAPSILASSAPSQSPLPRATDYQAVLGEEWATPEVEQKLLETEWLGRSRFGDQPDVDQFAGPICKDPVWVDELAEQLDLIAPMHLSFFKRHDELLQCIVPARFIIGRANRHEPPAPAWIAAEKRAIVANANYRSLSRVQLAVRRVRVEEVELKNLSRLIPTQLKASTLQPGETVRCTLPLEIRFTHFRIQLACCSDFSVPPESEPS